MASEVVEKLKAGAIPPPVMGLIARGAFPLPPEASIEALVFLLQDSRPEIRDQAGQTLEKMPEPTVLEILRSSEIDVSVVYYFADYSERNQKLSYLEAIVQNPSTSDEYLAFLASRLPPNLLDILATNQMRMIRHPPIMDAIEMNPQVSRDILRRVKEVREEFFIKKAAQDSVNLRQAASTATADTSAPTGLVKYGEKQATVVPKTLTGEALAKAIPPEFYEALEPEERLEGITPERVSVYQKIFRMNAQQRVQLALKGTREERSILIKDPNRIVVEGVLASPRLTETEVETFSLMRNMNEDILRKIATNRDWVKNYKIVSNLVLNPKTPIATSLGFLGRLHDKDVLNLTRNRNIPDVLRKAAQRLVQQRRDRG